MGIRQTHVILYNMRAVGMGKLAQRHVVCFQKKGSASGKAQRHKVLYLVVGWPLGLGLDTEWDNRGSMHACIHSLHK